MADLEEIEKLKEEREVLMSVLTAQGSLLSEAFDMFEQLGYGELWLRHLDRAFGRNATQAAQALTIWGNAKRQIAPDDLRHQEAAARAAIEGPTDGDGPMAAVVYEDTEALARHTGSVSHGTLTSH